MSEGRSGVSQDRLLSRGVAVEVVLTRQLGSKEGYTAWWKKALTTPDRPLERSFRSTPALFYFSSGLSVLKIYGFPL